MTSTGPAAPPRRHPREQGREVAPRARGTQTRPLPAAPATIPTAITERLLAQSDEIARRMARTLYHDIPLGHRYAERGYLRLVLRACRDGLRALLRQLHDGRRAHPAELAALGAAGVRQAEMGVPLEVLLQGYRVAAKVVWREVVDEAVRLGELSPPMVVTLSEQVLEYLDGISGAVGAAYLQTRERLVLRQDRERDRLLRRLIAGDASPELRRLATAADLSLSPPYRLVAVSMDDAVEDERTLVAAWRGAKALVAPDEPGMRLALVDPGADVGRLRDAAAAALGSGVALGVGPVAATLEEVGGAARRARDALRVGQRVEPEARLHHHAELGVLAPLLDDREAVDAHLAHVLGPLLEPRRAELRATLEAVLGSHGPAQAAERLGVHRHTVAYRMERVSELLGVDPDDPGERHRLWLALRLARLRSG